MSDSVEDDLRECLEIMTEELRIQRIARHAAENRADKAEAEVRELRKTIDRYNCGGLRIKMVPEVTMAAKEDQG